jgi:hypothetical protein
LVRFLVILKQWTSSWFKPVGEQVTLHALPSAVTSSSPQKKAAKLVLAALSNESKGSTRATNAMKILP